jgi:1-phosphofructokinase family hexose kinase
MIYTLTLNPAVDRELTVPAIEYDTVLRAAHSQVDFGGKGFNVSRLLQGLGVESRAVGFVGGKAGEVLRDGLQTLGIGTDFVWVDGETRTNVSIVTPLPAAGSGSHYIKVNEKGPTIRPEKQAELLAKIEGLARPGDWWVLAGSLPPGVPDAYYAQLVSLLQRRGAHTLLDTNGEPLRLGCQAGPFLVKPNLEEARSLTGMALGSPAEIARAAVAIHQTGVENVVISMGKDGALLLAQEAAWRVCSPPIVERNPIGAGDSMVGGLVYGLTQELSLREALGWGVASGAATASLSGTQVGSRPQIEALVAQIRYEMVRFV